MSWMSVVVRLKNGWTREGERKRDVGDGVAFIVELRQVASHSVSGRGGVGVQVWVVGWRDRNECFSIFFFLYSLFFISFPRSTV